LTLFRPATLVAAISLAFAAASAGAADAPKPAAASDTAPAASAPAALSAGLDKTGMDTAVRPQDNLFEATNGTWLKNTEIPADKPEYGTFIMLRDLSDERVKKIVDDLAAKPQQAGTVNAKIADYYSAYMDTAAIDKAGLEPLKPYLAQIDGLKSKRDLLTVMGKWQSVVSVPVDLQTSPDFKDPTIYAPLTWQGGLGMPDRDYYLKDGERFAKARAAYVSYVQKMLSLSGDKRASPHATAIVALERRIADIQWSKEANRDPAKLYNPMTIKELSAKAPGVDWKSFIDAGEMPVPNIISISQPSYVVALAKLINATPMDTWKVYLRMRLLDEFGGVLPQPYRDARFAFRGTALQGLKQDRPRWQKAVAALNNSMGEALGQVYVSEYFPPAYKARMVELVDNLLKTYKTSIDGLTWMTPATKAQAQDKLSKYGIKIGYPDKWRDYSKLEVKAGDAAGNEVRAARFEYLRQAVRVGHAVDRTEWGMTPQTVNAYYDPTKNEIVFPAAILQPPFFDMKADDAVNYGAIGAVIGHEISHGFDDQGSQFDGEGRLRNWWSDADRKAFEAITSKLVAQYDAYEPIKGAHVNGKLTLGENIADLSGLQISYKAYELSLGGKPAPVIDGLTGEQRFYLGWAQAWREKVREERALQLVTIDPHSPPQFRANGAAVNADGFHEAFGTKPGDAMYKAPQDRLRLW
jgi:putative endopeptidase